MAQDMGLTDTDDLGTADHIIIATLDSSPSLTKATIYFAAILFAKKLR